MRIFIITIGIVLLLRPFGYGSEDTTVQRFTVKVMQSEEDTNTVELKGGYFWIQPKEGQTEINIQVIKSIPKDKVTGTFELSWNAAQQDKLYGENDQVLGSPTQVTFTTFYKIKYASPKAFQEDVIISLEKLGDPTFKGEILISRNPYRMLMVKCQDRLLSSGEPLVIDSTIMRGDTFALNFDFSFDKALLERCQIRFTDTGILDRPGSFAMLNRKDFSRTILTDTVGPINGTIEFIYDCWELQSHSFSLPIRYHVTDPAEEASLILPFLLWVVLPLLIIGFLILLIYYWRKPNHNKLLEQLIEQLNPSNPKPNEKIQALLKRYVHEEKEKYHKYLITYNGSENGEEEEMSEQAREAITEIRGQFLEELITEDTAKWCDAAQLNLLKDKWSYSNSNGADPDTNTSDTNTSVTMGSFADPKMSRESGKGRKKNRSMKGKGPKYQEIINDYRQKEEAFQTRIKDYEASLGTLRKQLTQTQLDAESAKKTYNDQLNGLEKNLANTQNELTATQQKLDIANPYPDFINNYQQLLKDIHEFAVWHHPKLSEEALCYPLINTILYVQGQPRAVNPMFHQVIKDEYLLSILRLKEPQELKNLDAQTFFDAVINGRGFSLISTVGRLYAYSQVRDPNMDIRAQLEQEQIDCGMLGLLYKQVNEFLSEHFQTQLLLPDLLQSRFDEVRYKKNNFSYLFKHFKVPPLEDQLIYDVERVGFQSTVEGQAIIRPALVSYKLSND